MKPYVFSAASIDHLESGIKDYIAHGSTPTLALVFSSDTHDLNGIGKIFDKHGIDVFGASSAGEIVTGKTHEGTIAYMLTNLNRSYYKVKIFNGLGKDYYQLGEEIGEWAKKEFDNVALFLTAGGLGVDGEQIINGVKAKIDYTFPFFGGLAGTNKGLEYNTCVFNRTGSNPNGAVALVLDQNSVELKGTTLGGWKGIGTPKTITRSVGNIVYTIDDQPALDVYTKYLDFTSNLDLSRSNETGLLVERADGSKVMRAALLINEDKSIVYAGSMPEGSRIRFSISPGFEVIRKTIEQLNDFKNQVPKTDAVIVFSCVSRLFAFGSMIEKETTAISELWNVPNLGFFTFGEIGPGSTGQCDFHNYTLSLALIKEKIK